MISVLTVDFSKINFATMSMNRHLAQCLLAAALLLTALTKAEAKPSPADDARLIAEASDAIGLVSCDETTVGKIRAAARFSPAIGEYADLRAARGLDPRDSLKLAALQACIEAARSRAQEHPEALARTLYNTACLQGTLYDRAALANINEAIAAAKRAGKAAEEQLLLYETTRLYLLRNTFEGDNPMRFNELLTLEKRILHFYASHPETLDKAEMYYKFAQMKEYTDYVEDFDFASKKLFLIDPVASKAAPYEMTQQHGIPTNSPYYYRTSLDIYRRLWGDGCIDLNGPLIYSLFTQVGQGQDSRLIATADSIVAVLEGYFPEKDPNRVAVKYLRDQVAALAGYPLRFDWKYADMAAAYRDYFGAASPAYASMLLNLAANLNLAARAGSLPKAFYDLDEEYTAKARQAYADDIGQYAKDQIMFINAYEQHDAAKFNAKLADLTALLTDASLHHSWKSLTAMAYIVSYTYANGKDGTTIEMDNKINQCLDSLTGGQVIPLTVSRSQWTAQILEGIKASPDSVKQAYEKAIRQNAEIDLNLPDYAYAYANYLWGIGEYEAAKKEMECLLKQDCFAEEPVGEAYAKLYLGQMMIDGDDPDTATIHRLFKQAAPVLTADTAMVNAETVKGYLYIYYYYNNIGLTDKAGEVLEAGWDLAQRVCTPFYTTWQMFCGEMFTYYFDNKGDAAAERFNERQIAKLDSIGANNSTQYLELLWNRIIIASWRTPDDFTTLFVPYMQTLPVLFAVYERSGKSKHVLYDYGLRILSGAIAMTTRATEYINMNPEDIPTEYKEGWDYSMKMLQQWENYAIPPMLEMEKGFPDYAKPYDYRLNWQYLQLVNSLHGWYRYVKKDKERAEHYLKLTAETYNYNNQPWEADNIMAEYYLGEKDYAKAYEYSKKCNEQIKKYRDFDQIAVNARHTFLARQTGHDDEAVAVALERAGRIRRYVLGNFDHISSNERTNFLNYYGNSGMAVNNMLTRRPKELAAPAYDAALFDKGLLLHSWERVRRSILRSGDKTLIAQMDTLDRLNKQRNAVKIGVGDQVSYNKYTAMQYDIDRLEKRVAAATAKFRTDTMRTVAWREVQAKLDGDDAAIEFVIADSVLVALVLRPGYDSPHYVRLCFTKDVADLLHTTDSFPAETRTRRLYTYGRSPLYDLLWRPLEKELQGVKTVYYSPTAFLHRIAFAALPVSADSCLIDRYDLRYVTTTARLLLPANRRRAATATVFGGISYSPGQAEAAMQAGDGNRAAVEEEFAYLAETKAEADTITSDMRLAAIEAGKYTGELATEPAFYSLDGNSTDIIHIATHGFYIPDTEAGTNLFLANHPSSKHSPMQRTGLAFAGANTTWAGAGGPDNNDGILTANELSLLDLGRADLVVLSACETALGDYSIEGVFGLQRGFKEAGAHTLILSLWSVNDKATASFMQDFYRHWLGGATKHEAFTKAVASLRRTHPTPFFWAAYVMLDADS